MRKKMLRDVMNSKSDKHFRHSADAYNIKWLSNFYAIESRINNAVWDDKLDKYIRGPLWFTNIMVFDFDFDEKNFPGVNYDEKLNESLEKLENILGTPRYIIKNKNKNLITQREIAKYYTYKGKVNIPKDFGCQVVYELSDSIKSQYVESVNLYNHLRLTISKIVDSDLNFKGHMFKNPYNNNLFNIEENDNYSKVNIYDISKKYCNKTNEDIDVIKNMKPFESFNDDKNVPKIVRDYSNRLYNYYYDLNSWVYPNERVKFGNNISMINSTAAKVSSSRNETLFSYLKSIPLSVSESVTYEEIINSKIFDQCNIKESLSREEFESTKASVTGYIRDNNIEVTENHSNFDNRVFKFDQKSFDEDFYMNNKGIVNSSIRNLEYMRMAFIPWQKETIEINLYNEDDTAKRLSDLFFLMNPDFVLSNIRNLITPGFLDAISEALDIKSLGLWDKFCIIRDAVYLTHFKYYNLVQEFRKSIRSREIEKVESVRKTDQTIKIERLESFGLYYEGKLIKFKEFYLKLRDSGLLKECGNPKAVSFYRSHFKIRNQYASELVSNIKAYLKLRTTIKKMKDVIYQKNGSRPSICLNRTFNIYNDNKYSYSLYNVYSINRKLFNNTDKCLYDKLLLYNSFTYCDKLSSLLYYRYLLYGYE